MELCYLAQSILRYWVCISMYVYLLCVCAALYVFVCCGLTERGMCVSAPANAISFRPTLLSPKYLLGGGAGKSKKASNKHLSLFTINWAFLNLWKTSWDVGARRTVNTRRNLLGWVSRTRYVNKEIKRACPLYRTFLCSYKLIHRRITTHPHNPRRSHIHVNATFF